MLMRWKRRRLRGLLRRIRRIGMVGGYVVRNRAMPGLIIALIITMLGAKGLGVGRVRGAIGGKNSGSALCAIATERAIATLVVIVFPLFTMMKAAGLGVVTRIQSILVVR